MRYFIIIIAMFLSLHIDAKAEGGSDSQSALNDYAGLMIELRREAEGEKVSTAKKKTAAKKICPHLEAVKSAPDPVQALVGWDKERCAELYRDESRCTGGGLTGIGAQRALLRSLVSEACKIGKKGK